MSSGFSSFELGPGVEADYDEVVELVDYRFDGRDPSRREFLQLLGAGLLIAVSAGRGSAQAPGRRRGGGGGGEREVPIAARLHIGQDGAITVMTGKVECGQGARAELTQAAAEELRVAPEAVRLLMADTALVPDDGGTFGSRSTPSTVPAVRRGGAAARQLLAATAARRWGADAGAVEVREGKAFDAEGRRCFSYAELAGDEEALKAFGAAPGEVALTPAERWTVLGVPLARPNGREIVAGAHRYPSDIERPGMLYGRVLRRPSYGAKLVSVDLGPARAMEGVTVVGDGEFVGVAAPSSYRAGKALAMVAETARWEDAPHPSSEELFDYLREHARGGVPENPHAEELKAAAKRVRRTYQVPYVQHAPMEPRAAVAEWEGDGVTVWTATQNPFAVRGEVARAFGLNEAKVRVIIPDFGGGFGGKHSGECAVEAARLAKAAGRPVRLVWTRAEEFTWAAFRPAGWIEAEASLDGDGRITSWHFVNVNSGGNSIQPPYRVGRDQSVFVPSDPPLRHGSYRALATTANTFARECFLDELAAAAGRDALEFRREHLDPGRLRDVLEAAAGRFGWASKAQAAGPGVGVGLACGLDKGSYVAACVEVAVEDEAVVVRRVCQAFDCGRVLDPVNLRRQVEGAIVMGLGPALREAMRFEGGKVLNASFGRYRVPRFADVPELDVHLLDRPDLPSAGAGETPLIAVAPAIANAVSRATGERVAALPIRPGAGA